MILMTPQGGLTPVQTDEKWLETAENLVGCDFNEMNMQQTVLPDKDIIMLFNKNTRNGKINPMATALLNGYTVGGNVVFMSRHGKGKTTPEHKELLETTIGGYKNESS